MRAILSILLVSALAGTPARAAEPACPRPEVHIHKGKGELVLTCAGQVRLRTPVTFGGDPVGHKLRSGDHRTPEGRYSACSKHRSKRFYKFIAVSYPGPQDVASGLSRGLISRGQQAAILAAHRRRRCPPFGTRLGGAIGIHGYKHALGVKLWNRVSRLGKIYRYMGLSDGCIMVDNDQMDRLWELVRVGTPIYIHGHGAE